MSQATTQKIFSPAVELVNAFSAPYDNAVATARTCYSSRIITPDEVGATPESRARRDAIAKSTFLAGHHTTLQHSTFQFAISGVSRQVIWSFLHSHPFYNSEQVSQRYVTVAKENFVLPACPAQLEEPILSLLEELMQAYETLCRLVRPAAEKEYRRIFPQRALTEKKWSRALDKRCQEVARYVLPLATTAHLYHTVSGLTLLRYQRLCEAFDAPQEQKVLVNKMVEAVAVVDAEFFKHAQDPLPLEATPEFAFFSRETAVPSRAERFIAEFDASLAGKFSRLIDYKANAQSTMAAAVRSVLGVTKPELSDEKAIRLVLDPAQNGYLSETLNLTHHAKLARVLAHPHFTFRKKISHTADSQDQRHRTVPASRPILARHLTVEPDFLTPALITADASALDFYRSSFERLWKRIGEFLNAGLSPESALYLLPNAVPIRFEESGSLQDLHHKWTHRLCYTAQEEIWRASLEEVQQVEERFPLLTEWMAAPCKLRERAAKKPFCPEGDRFCGVPVWKLRLEDYSRMI